MLKKYRAQQGFTIVELLIVIVVIGILAAITIAVFTGMQNRARESAASADATKLSRLLALHRVDNGRYPDDLSTIDSGKPFSATASSSASYRTSDGGAGYCATVTNINRSVTISNVKTTPQPGGCPGDGVNGVAAITNLVANPSFESGSASWTWANGSGYTGGASTTQAFSGTSSFAITAPTTEADRYLETYVSVPAGTYTISSYVYLTGTGTTFQNRDSFMHISSGTGTNQGAEPKYDRSKLNQWQRIERTVVTPDTRSLRIRFYGITGATTYFDGVMVTSGSSAPVYADGNTPNWIWNGAANNSTSTGPPQ